MYGGMQASVADAQAQVAALQADAQRSREERGALEARAASPFPRRPPRHTAAA